MTEMKSEKVLFSIKFFIVLCKIILFYRNAGVAPTAGAKALPKPPEVF
jgi:hypothetical protein